MVRGLRFAPLIMLFVLAVLPARGDGTPNALADAASAALKTGNAENADNLATQALAIGALSREDRAHVLINRGLARERLQRHALAVIDFNAALDLDALQPDDQARAIFDRGVTYDEMGHTEWAIGDYTAALRLAPDFALALNNRANAYRRTGKLDDAKRDYLASLAATNPQPEFPQYGLGQIAEAQKDVDAARDWYKKALTSNPKYALASQRLAVIGDAFTPVLRRPAPTTVAANDDTIVLRPPVDRPKAEPKPEARKFVPLIPTVAPAAYAPPDDSPTLRPAIVEALDDTPVTAAAPVRSRTAARTASTGSAQIQLGAWKAEADAADGWNHIVGQSGHLLDGMTPQIVMADIPGKGRYYRLRAEPTAGVSAANLCARLAAQNIACMPVK